MMVHWAFEYGFEYILFHFSNCFMKSILAKLQYSFLNSAKQPAREDKVHEVTYIVFCFMDIMFCHHYVHILLTVQIFEDSPWLRLEKFSWPARSLN